LPPDVHFWNLTMMLFERIKTWLRDSHNLAALMLSLMPLVLICLYVVRYSVSYPDADDWVGPVDMAYDIKNGTFSAADIVEPTRGIHRAATYHVVLYLLVQLTDWNTHLVAYIMLLLGLLRLGILAMLFAETLPRRLFVVLLPFSALILAVDQTNGWHTGIFMVWHFVSLFALAAVLVLKKAKPGWPALLGAAVLCGLATSSQGTGWFVSYPVLLVTLWMFGYRRPGYFVFWIVVSLVALRLYTLGLPGESGQTDVSIINKAANIHHLLMWITAFLGNPFTTLLDRSLPFVVGSLGLIVMALNLGMVQISQKVSLTLWLASRAKRTDHRLYPNRLIAPGYSLCVCHAGRDADYERSEITPSSLGRYAGVN
jgi:hypothetical protein